MYTEKSIDLKSDFYERYGEVRGRLHFVKVGLPCVLFDGKNSQLVFSLSCGVRAYGRGYGDVLKILNSDSNVCDVHFVKNGKGAQILYRQDLPDVKHMRDTAMYAVNKLLYKMNNVVRIETGWDTVSLCDRYAPEGWCAVSENGSVKSAPLPLNDYNVLLIRTGKTILSGDIETKNAFYYSERERISMSYKALKDCKTDVLFDCINESQKSIERLLSPKPDTVAAVHATYGIDGVCATRICDIGIICFCKSDKTDNVILNIRNECYRQLGYSARISVVK